MSKKLLAGAAGIAIVALFLGVVVGRLFLSPTSRSSAPAGAMESERETATPTVWTCSMHPQIRQPGPGACPICGMDLIPLERDPTEDDGPRRMSMSESSRALA